MKSGALSYLALVRAGGVWTQAWPARSYKDGLGNTQESSDRTLLEGSPVVMEDWPGTGLGTKSQHCSPRTFASPCWLALAKVLS